MMDNAELEKLDQDVQHLASERRLSKLEEALDTYCEVGFGKTVKHKITTTRTEGYDANTDGNDSVHISVAGFNFLQIRALSLHETAHLLYSKAIEVPTADLDARGRYYDPIKRDQRMAIQNGLEDGRVENKMSYRWPVTTNFLRWMAASDLVHVASEGNFQPENLVAAMKWYVANFGRLHMPQGLKAKTRKLYEASGVKPELLDKAEDCTKRYLLAQSQVERDNIAIELTKAITEEAKEQNPGGGSGGSGSEHEEAGIPGTPNNDAGMAQKAKGKKGESKADKEAQQEMEQDIKDLTSQPPEQDENGDGQGEQPDQSQGEGVGQPQGEESGQQQQDGSGQPQQSEQQQGSGGSPQQSEQDIRDSLTEVGEQLSEMMEEETDEDTRNLATEVLGGAGHEPDEAPRQQHETPDTDMKRHRDELRRIIQRIEIDGRALHLRKSGRIHTQTLMKRFCAGKGVLTNFRVFKGLTDDTHGGKLDVFIALDKSGSMQETWLEQAGRLSWEVGQAVEQSGGRCKVLGFDTDIYHYKNTPERYTIPGRGGGTHLASIMSEAVLFFRQSNPDNGKLLVMLTDTDLGDVDRVIKMLHVLRQAGVVIWMGAILPHVSPEENDSGNVVDELQKACPFMNAGAAKLRGVDCWRTPAIHDMLMGAVKEFLMDFRKAMVGR